MDPVEKAYVARLSATAGLDSGQVMPFKKGDTVVQKPGRATDIPEGLRGTIKMDWWNGGVSKKIDCGCLELYSAHPAQYGWQGTEPAEGTRRALIRDAIREAGGFNPGPGGPNAASLRLADAVETALQKIDIGADPTGETSPASNAMRMLDKLGIASTQRDGRILTIDERVGALVKREQECEELAEQLREVGDLALALRDHTLSSREED